MASANQESWIHVPQALVKVRNDMVYSNVRLTNIPLDAYRETRELGLWYLDLMLPHKYGHEGEYANKLTSVQGQVPPSLYQGYS